MKTGMLGLLMLVMALTSGCAIFAPRERLQTYREGQEAIQEEYRTNQYDWQMYRARSRARHQEIVPLEAGKKAVVLIEAPGIINDLGYIYGLDCVLINDSRYELRVEVDDPHGQEFIFRVPPATVNQVTVAGHLEVKLEAGLHRIKTFRSWDSRPWGDGSFLVKSDRYYHTEFGHYFGGARLFGS